MNQKWTKKIKVNDTVKVLVGKDRGKIGKVLKVLPSKNKVIVQGVNVVKKHKKPTSADKTGEIIEKTLPIAISNVSLVDKDNKPSKVGFKEKNGNKVRFLRKTGEEL